MGFAGVAAFGATAPDWVQKSLAEDNANWRPAGNAILLLEARTTRFLPPDGSSARCRMRSVLEIRTEEGQASALAALPYNPDTCRVLSARAWIVSPDGKKTKAFDRADFVDSVAEINNYMWNSERKLVFDGRGRAEVGGALAWEFEIERQNELKESDESFLHSMPVWRAEYDVIPVPGGRLDWFATASRLRSPVPGSEPGALHWELDRQAPLSGERPETFFPNLLFVHVRSLNSGTSPSERSWADVSRLADGIFEPRFDAGREIKARSEELMSGKPDRWERIRALTDFVQKQIVYLSLTLDTDSLAGLRPHPAAEVLRNRYGDCKDKATLLVSMLRSVGEGGYPVLLYAANQKAVSPDWPSPGEFNHAIVAIPADGQVPSWWPVVDLAGLGRVVIFDPTDPTTPLGLLSSADQGGWGLVVSPRGGSLFSLPASDPSCSRIERHVEAVLTSSGAMSVKIRQDEIGEPGAIVHAQRSYSSADEFDRKIEGWVHETLPLARAMQCSDDWDAHLGRHRLDLEFAVPQYGRPMADGMILVSPALLPAATPLAPWRTRNEGSVWLSSYAMQEEVRLHLPDGYVVEELPDPFDQDQADCACHLAYRTEGRDVVFQMRLERQARSLDKNAYETLRGFWMKAQDSERSPILLRRAT